jgi:hypothetical protein
MYARQPSPTDDLWHWPACLAGEKWRIVNATATRRKLVVKDESPFACAMLRDGIDCHTPADPDTDEEIKKALKKWDRISGRFDKRNWYAGTVITEVEVNQRAKDDDEKFQVGGIPLS